MGRTRRTPHRAASLSLLACFAAGLLAWPAGSEPLPRFREDGHDRPDGIHVLDGSYVLDAGRLAVNITNHGLIGSHYSAALTYSHAPSAQWPAGTGDEYLYGAGLWIGARLGGQISVTTGQPERELRPGDEVEDTIYESYEERIRLPFPDDRRRGSHMPDPFLGDDDRDGATDEDMLNGYDDDGDGEIDEDYGQIGDQMMTCTMYDDTRLAREIYSEHRPLGVRVVQRAAAWHDKEYEDMIALDFEIKNENYDDLEDLYLGFYVDCDIQNRTDAATQPDDLTGYFDGAVRDETGAFHRLQVGWMKDAARDDPLPGVLGVVVLDHDTDFTERHAPRLVRLGTYQRFTTGATVYQGGEPQTDADRYALMARTRPDRDAREDKPDDYRFLVSSGPFPLVEPGRTLHYRVAMVVGDGLEGMLAAALRASALQRGRWFELDYDFNTGGGNRETKICIGDLPRAPDGSESLFSYRADIMDETCTGSEPRFGYPRISRDMLYEDEDGRMCVYVNADNCEECFRAVGVECTQLNELFWEMGRYVDSRNRWQVYTGSYGEHRQPWLADREVPPPRPHMRAVAGDHRVEVFWDDHAEHAVDDDYGVADFESYRIWRVTGWHRPAGVDDTQAPPARMWNMVAEYDLKNVIPAGLDFNLEEHPLGRNTGLENIVYTPRCLADPRYAGLADAMAAVVRDDIAGTMETLPPVRRLDGSPTPGLERLLPWDFAGDVLDTFFAVTSRVAAPGVVPKPARRFYHYVDHDVPNGFRAYVAVTARDHRLVWHEDGWAPVGYGIELPAEANYATVTPGFAAQTADDRAASGTNIYVYPNPVTREALAAFDQQEPTLLDATGSRIAFANLPRALNTITVYTASGDLVQSIEHDGHREGGQAYWNLMSRNGQEIVSGIYLYVVHAHEPGFEDFVGRFVVIR